jgi:hypothetical protein
MHEQVLLMSAWGPFGGVKSGVNRKLYLLGLRGGLGLARFPQAMCDVRVWHTEDLKTRRNMVS